MSLEPNIRGITYQPNHSLYNTITTILTSEEASKIHAWHINSEDEEMVEGGMVLLYETGSLFKGFMYEDLSYYCENKGLFQGRNYSKSSVN